MRTDVAPAGTASRGLAPLLAVAARRGITRARLLAGTGLGHGEPAGADGLVSCEQEHRAIENFIDLGGAAHGIGLEVGASYRFTTLGPLGFAMVSSPTLREATRRLVEYHDLFDAFTRPRLLEEDGCVRVAFRPAGAAPELAAFVQARAVAAVLALWRDISRRTLQPLDLSLGFARPLDDDGYARFAGIAVGFGAETRISLGATELSHPLPHADAYALRMAESQCRQSRQAAREAEGVAGRVKAFVRSRTACGLPDMAEVASALCMSERTLRRRLQREGTTFAALCSAMRELAAEQLLRCRHLPIDHIAERLGYAEAASFIHAFKRWKGRTPHAFRLESSVEAVA